MYVKRGLLVHFFTEIHDFNLYTSNKYYQFNIPNVFCLIFTPLCTETANKFLRWCDIFFFNL